MTDPTPLDVYRAAAEAYMGDQHHGTEWLAEQEFFRAAIDLAVEHGRQVAAKALRDRADEIEVEPSRFGPRATLRRHLWMAARIAAGPMTGAEQLAALNDVARGSGALIVCNADDIEPTS